MDIFGIEVEGFFVERFFNMCSQAGINLWRTRKKKNGAAHTNILASDFKKIKKIAKKTRCRVKINKKRGIPFVARKYKNRKVFIFLFFTLIISIIILSNYIWNIEITGNSDISSEELFTELSNLGLKQGISKSKVNTNEIIEKIRLKDDRIAWIGIKIEGTNARVNIVESVKKPDIIDENEYCDIISNKEGIITKINVTNGTAQVKVGDVVESGQKLIGGWMEGKYTGVRYMHASGNIEAKVWYSSEKEEKFIQEEKKLTSNKENKYGININKNEINFYKRLSKFKNYDKMETRNKVKIFDNFYLPIEFKKITNYEYKIIEKQYSEQELQAKVIDELEEQMKNKVANKQIVNRNVTCDKTEDGLKIKLIYEVIEDIGVEQKLIS